MMCLVVELFTIGQKRARLKRAAKEFSEKPAMGNDAWVTDRMIDCSRSMISGSINDQSSGTMTSGSTTRCPL